MQKSFPMQRQNVASCCLMKESFQAKQWRQILALTQHFFKYDIIENLN